MNGGAITAGGASALPAISVYADPRQRPTERWAVTVRFRFTSRTYRFEHETEARAAAETLKREAITP